MFCRFRIGVICCALWLSHAQSEIVEIGPGDNLSASISAMQPGDILLLQSGVYTLTNRLGISLSCTSLLPCKIRAKPGHTPHIHRPNADQNIIDIENTQHLVIEGIEFSGGSRGLRLNNSSHITLKRNHIHGTADAGIAANDSGVIYTDLKFLENHIHDTGGTGEGMYLGCNFNVCQVSNSVIEGNYIHHTNAVDVTQGDGIELKEGSWGNVIKDNVIHDTNYPCIITYSTVGNGSANIIERNLMWNCGDHAIQSAADAIIRNNIILSAVADGIRSQPHQSGTPDNLSITHNTILKGSNNAIRLNSISGDVLVANNALYAPNGNAIQASGTLAELIVANNFGEGALNGVGSGFNASGDIDTDFVNASFSGAVPQDVFPSSGSPLISAANSSYNAAVDFNFFSRNGSLDVGAYRFQANGNPGWVLDNDFKPLDVIFQDRFEL